MSKYLVTGGAGFIGSNLIEKLVADQNEVVVVDDLSMGKKENLKSIDDRKLTFYEKSITDYEFMEKLLVSENFDYIVLLGAVASVADSVENPYATHLINQEANINIYEVVRRNKLKVRKILMASSAAVYGNNPVLPKKETSSIEPLTPYAIDKFASERFAMIYGRLYNIPTVATRFFNVYGPKQNPNSPYSGVLSIIHNCLVNDKTFTVFGDGEQLRDFTYVDDVVSAVRLLLETEDVKWDVFNVGTGSTVTLNEVIKAFEKAMGKKLDVIYADERKGDIKKSYADISKITETVSYKPKYNIVSGLAAYIAKQ
ncbi:epimerase [Ligilactobacillus agilis]|uniref:Epimerase n=1 Tax=Ligilactobacillus agilis TaxID=1601 RepID=A0A2I2AC87_9LACO|nr:GDP-mannose 4,6-dehydratase [Ligilactobacillus agilis]PLA76967.1 epimerase [Ligilactobacillus agilis]PLA83401.1 epimerase [Ligilactobacillus agilis]